MAYTALYRKFRPGTFDDVKGQDAIVRTLSNQIKNDRIGHAYLFCGTRGTGKTSVAKILARAVNCENPVNGSPCNECAVCRGIIDGSSMNVVEIDAASNNSVDNVRQIVDEVKYSPTEGKYRVYIIDEVHMLTPGAFNALLKTLEEPPAYVMFILATTEAHKIPITIMSRCQRYDFKRISIETITARLSELCEKENIEAEDAALRYIARLGDGSMRDALSLLERCRSFFFEENITYDKVLDVLGTTDIESFAKMLRYVHAGDVHGCMKMTDRLVEQGRDLPRFIVDFTWYMRNLLLTGTGADIAGLLGVNSEQLEIMKHESKVFDAEELIRYISIMGELTNRLRFAVQKRVLIETELIKLCRPEMEKSEASYIDRIKKLETAIAEIKKNGVLPQSGAAEQAVITESPEPKKKIELSPATRADVIRLRDNWSSIQEECTTKLLEMTIIECKPQVTGADKLQLVFADAVDVDVANERRDEIKAAIEKYMQKTVEFDIVDSEHAAEEAVDVKGYETELEEEFGVPVDNIESY